MTKQEQIEEMAKIVDEMYNVYTTTADDIADGLYNAGYRKTPDDIRELIDVLAEGANIKEKLDEIKRLKKENACLLKACEGQFTFDTTEDKKYSIFNSVRKVFADEVKAKLLAIFGKTICSDLDTEDITDIIDELLKEYE